MVSDWKICRLGDLTENFDSQRIPVKESDRTVGPYPYYGASGIIDWINDYIFDGEFLLVAEDGENLRSRKTPIAFIAEGKFWVNNHAHIVRGNDRALTEFLLYALSNTDINGHLTGSTIPKLTQENMNMIPLRTPPLYEQRRIVQTLGSLDHKIHLNSEINKSLESMVRSVFKSWFIDFDPVRAKAEGRTLFGMDDETAALFPDSFENSEPGSIPRGWKPVRLSDVAVFTKGASYRSSDLAQSDTALVTLKSVSRGGGYSHDGLKTYAGEFDPSQEVSAGEVVVAHTDLTQAAEVLGRAARIQPSSVFSNLVISLDLTVVRGRENWCSNEFIYGLLADRRFADHAYGYSNGTTVLHLSSRALEEYEFPLPSTALIKSFSEIVSPMLHMVDVNSEVSTNLANLRDAILPKLLSGEIRISTGQVKDMEQGEVGAQ